MKRSTSHLRETILAWLDGASKVAAIVAVIMAGIWTYYIADITGETELNPEVWVHTQVVPYSRDTRLLVARVNEKNMGKVPVELGPDALVVTVKRVPDSLPTGSIDLDKQPIAYQRTGIFKRYDGGIYLEAGMQLEDLAEFVVPPGLYQIEANLALPDGDIVNDMTIQEVP